MAATTMRLCGNKSGELVCASEILYVTSSIANNSDCWGKEDLAATVERMVCTVDGILEAVSQPNRKPKDLTEREIEPKTVEKELGTLCEELATIIKVVNVDFKNLIPKDGIVVVHGRKIDLPVLTSVIRLQQDCIAAHAKEYAKLY